MDKTFQLKIVTPTHVFKEEDISYIRAESVHGQFGIMSHHTAATITLSIGSIKVVKSGKNIFYATNGGFVDVCNNKVLMLVETAESISDISIERAKAAKLRAEERLIDKKMDKTRALISLARAKNRLKIANW